MTTSHYTSTDDLFQDISDEKKESDAPQSFLSELQQEGKARGKIEIQDFQTAIDGMCVILNQEALEQYRSTDEASWPTVSIDYYCQDCHDIVEVQTQERKGRACLDCGSKKIAEGRKEALQKYYGIKNQK